MPGIERIVVGVDGSDTSRKALVWAYDEAGHHGASLVVVTTWQPPTLPLYGSVPPEEYGDQPRKEALELLERFTSELVPKDPAVDIRTSVEEGKNPAKVLIERSKDADLVVVGSRGHGGFVGMLLGSVSQHIVAHAECPVVVVR
jgi:nucleotide-binding universal stress UspA family protein